MFRFFALALLTFLPATAVVGQSASGQQAPGENRAATGDAGLLEFAGPTMGTRYMVKIYDPPADVSASDLQFSVDAELRRVNDQMSTYLKHSEISRFNSTDSTDWFEVSEATASVVQFSQEIAKKTDGAFDITIGPLVNAWSFGPDPRTRQVPEEAELKALRERVGYEKLEVRMDPPALKKAHPDLQIDLSAVAKGYGVDRVVQTLAEMGAENVFVEVGGEVRTSGNKGGQWWKVGIQLPDAETEQVMIAYSMNTGGGDDTSMATSGDYRNYFEADGQRYSHTIDPTTGSPITHALASVSVVSESCMAADAWATAINVMGPDRGLEIARQQNLNALLVSRGEDDFEIAGTGSLARYADNNESDGLTKVDAELPGDDKASQWGAVLAITTIAFALALLAMAIGVMFGRRAISGSCGGLANKRNEDGSVSCSLCSNPDNACKELRERMQKQDTTTAP